MLLTAGLVAGGTGKGFSISSAGSVDWHSEDVELIATDHGGGH